MQISTENIKISHFLIGFHSFTKDHNFTKFKGDLINNFEKELKLTLDAFPLGREHIIRTMDRDSDLFEIKITPQAIIYQDVLPLEEMIDNAKKFLGFWRGYSDLVNLRLVGIVRNFSLEIAPNKDEKTLNISEKFFKNLNLGEKYLTCNFGIRFNKQIEGATYNIHLKMNENTQPQYGITGLIDFNQVAPSEEKKHTDDNIDKIFNTSKTYFENDFIEFLNN